MAATVENPPRRPGHGPSPGPREDYTAWMIFRERGALDLRQLSADDIDIRDIVYSLANTNRYNSQTRTPVSVLWHSLMVEAVCADRRPKRVCEALFHDAGEAYFGDWIRPLKELMGSEALKLKNEIQETCFLAAGIPRTEMKPGTLSRAVRTADHLMLRYEIQAKWGYDRTVSWHRGPNDLERQRVEKAIHECGEPSRDPHRIDAWVERFLWLANELVPAGAPLHRSIHETLVELAQGQAAVKPAEGEPACTPSTSGPAARSSAPSND